MKKQEAWFNFLPESRHNKSWVLFDLQSSSDMFIGIRNQVDIRIIKRSTSMLLGDDLGWFLTMIEKKRENLIEKLGVYSPEVKAFVDKKYPRITEIPDNKGYVLLKQKKYHQAWQFFEKRIFSKKYENKLSNIIKNYLLSSIDFSKEKKIAILAEQGLGDQILFSSMYKNILNLEINAKFINDVRLGEIFERSFNNSESISNK